MVTPLNKLIQYVRDNKEMSSFACWKLGFKYFSNKVQLDSNKVYYYAHYCLHQLHYLIKGRGVKKSNGMSLYNIGTRVSNIYM